MTGAAATNQRADPVVALHRVAGRVFELSGLRTGSVRDQALRAALLVDRLSAAPKPGGLAALIGPDSPLLVIGGGAAGLTAAVRATEAGVPVVLLEATRAVMATQLGIQTRIIDPVEYDWPQVHWRTGSFPPHPGDADLPISLRRNTAGDLATLWQLQVHVMVAAAAGRGARLRIEHQTRIARLADGRFALEVDVSADPDQPQWQARGMLSWDEAGVTLRHDDSGMLDRFGAAISCVGFGQEIVQVPDRKGGTYTGACFWGNDRLSERHLGLPRNAFNQTALVNVLVSGGGDGAQQDIQRALTKRCGRELFELFAEVDPGFAERIPTAELALADDAGRRAHAWSAIDRRNTAALSLSRWHQAYVRAVDTIWNSWQEPLQRQLLSRVIRDQDQVHLTWLLSTPVPTYSYGLNRLLTLLVLRLHELATQRPLWCEELAKTHGDKPIVIANARLESVDTDSTGLHTARVAPTAAAPGVGSRPVPLGEFDIVVVRHGIEVASLFGSPPVAEQIVPFGFPG